MSFRTIAATRQNDMKANIALDATKTRAAGLLVAGLDGVERCITLYENIARIKNS